MTNKKKLTILYWVCLGLIGALLGVLLAELMGYICFDSGLNLGALCGYLYLLFVLIWDVWIET